MERGIAMTKEEELRAIMETMTTRELLTEISGGVEPSKAEIKLIDEVQEKTGLNSGVMNVLIYYVLLKTDMKLLRGYVQKLANHWAEKNIESVQEAMELVKRENQKYTSLKTRKEEVTPVEKARCLEIEKAILSGISDEELGKFVRKMFSNE